MSINLSAKIYCGFELMPNWENIVSEEDFEEYEDYFVIIDQWRDSEPSLFAIEIDSVEEGSYSELNTTVIERESNILTTFYNKYPQIFENSSPKYYLAAVVN